MLLWRYFETLKLLILIQLNTTSNFNTLVLLEFLTQDILIEAALLH